MQSNISSIVAMLLLLFAGNVFAAGYGCYHTGKTWSDIGTTEEVELGLAGLCQQLVGSYPTYTQKSACSNVNDHGVSGSILVVEVPHGHLGADVSQEACMDFMKQVQTKCEKGGELGLLQSRPDQYGGDRFKANVILDPDWDRCKVGRELKAMES